MLTRRGGPARGIGSALWNSPLQMQMQLSIAEAPEPGASSGQTSPKTYTGIYAMHKYWSKKPFNLVSEYIDKFSKPGDTVLDCFSGSGVTLIEAIRLRRRAIGIDINPAAVFMTDAALRSVNIRQLRARFNEIKRTCAELVNSLYRTTCATCNSDNALATHLIWKNGLPVEVWFSCTDCKTKKGIKGPDATDRERAARPMLEPRWYPSDLLHTNTRINVKEGTRVSDLFAPRALVALSIIFERIKLVEADDERAILMSCFTATLPQASKMVFVIRRRGKATGSKDESKAEVGSWVIGFWVPKEHFEINAWRCFENRFTRTMRGKVEMQQLIERKILTGAAPNSVLYGNADYSVSIGNAAQLPLPDESIDYAFIDPPHGNRIPYLELSMIWNSWLAQDADWGNEIIVSEAPGRKKNVADYNVRMEHVFRELARVLRPTACLSVVFNSLDDETWVSFVGAIRAAGFDIAELTPLAYSANSVVQDNRENALKTDFVMSCVRTVVDAKRNPLPIINETARIDAAITAALAAHSGLAETYEILNYVLVDCIPKGNLITPTSVIAILSRNCTIENGRWRHK